MWQLLSKCFAAFVSLLFTHTSLAGTIVLGLNLEFIDGEFSNEAFDGGWGFHAGYEFKTWEKWSFGTMFEYMNGWYKKEDLDLEGEMKYDSRSIFATARPESWPLMFKAGFVKAKYSVLLDTGTNNFRDENDWGYGYGAALVIGGSKFRFDLLDVKRIKIGSDTFTSYGINITVVEGLTYD